ncbi:MAG: hypothetical protein K1X94_18165 [Sandaracinaceae bacterium]|nr:hypothetical protein [Sandaracinaceae bacterium]
MSSPGQLLITDRASIDRVMRGFGYTCVADRPLPPLAEISTIADVNRVFSVLEGLEPFSVEVTLGIGSRRVYASGSRLYVSRQDASIGALDALWQLEDSWADQIFSSWLRPQREPAAEADQFLVRLRPFSTAASRATKALAVYCYEAAF